MTLLNNLASSAFLLESSMVIQPPMVRIVTWDISIQLGYLQFLISDFPDGNVWNTESDQLQGNAAKDRCNQQVTI